MSGNRFGNDMQSTTGLIPLEEIENGYSPSSNSYSV